VPRSLYARLIAVAGPAIVSLLVGVVALRQISRLTAAHERELRGVRVVQALESLLLRTVQAEASLRGFIVTADERYVREIDSARHGADAELDTAIAIVADSGNRARLVALKQLQAGYRQLVDSVISVRRTRGEAAALAAARPEPARMDSVRALKADIERAEQRGLSAASAREHRQITTLRTIVLLGLIGAVLLALLANLLLQRQERSISAHANDLESERRRLLAVLGQSPLSIVIIEAPSGRVMVANSVAGEILGEPPTGDALTGRRWRGFKRDGTPYLPEEWPLTRAISQGERVTEEVIAIERPTGIRRLISVSAAPVRGSDGTIEAAIAIFTDVTEAERVSESLRQARFDAEAANRAKTEFLAVMSHELRTPLAAITGYTELLADGITGPVSEAQREQLGRIAVSAEHLLRIIEDILTMSRIEAGREVAAIEPVKVRTAVDEAMNLTQPMAAAKGLTMRTDPAIEEENGGTPLTVRADPVRYRQILLNLLSNAIKFTDRGEIVISWRRDHDGIVVEVRDPGIGIAPADMERVFDPFWQVEARYTRSVGGTGLGLSVTRRLARLMEGEIRVRSQVGVGSTFAIWLPAVEDR